MRLIIFCAFLAVTVNTAQAECRAQAILFQPLALSVAEGEYGQVGTLRQAQEGAEAGEIVGKITLDRASFAVQTPDGETVAYIQSDLTVDSFDTDCEQFTARLNLMSDDFFIVESGKPVGSISGKLPKAHFEVEGLASAAPDYPPANAFEDDLGSGMAYAQGTTFRIIYCEPNPMVISTFLDHGVHNVVVVEPFAEAPYMAARDDYEDWHRLCEGLAGSYQ